MNAIPAPDDAVPNGGDWTAEFCETPQRPIGPVKRARKPTPASKLRKAVIESVKTLGYLGSKPVVTPVYSGHVEMDGKRYALGRPGASDLVVCWHGGFFALELKAGADQQRDSQKAYAARISEAHGVYVIVRQPQDAIDAMMRWYQVNIGKLQARER